MSTSDLSRVEIQGMTRSAFILRGALAAGAAYGIGAVGPYVSGALGATAGSDLKIIEFALSLEQIEAAFYEAGLAQGGLTGDVQKLATEFGAHEAEHATALEKLLTQLGSKPAPAPKTKFPVNDQASFVQLAVALEDTGIAAYNGAAPLLATPDLLAALGGIVQVEARHSGALRMLAGMDPAPAAFDKPLAPGEVSARVQKYVQS
jgi:rubrerythrin